MSDIKSFFSDDGVLPEQLDADKLKPKVKSEVNLDSNSNIEFIDDIEEVIEEETVTTSTQTSQEKVKNIGDVINDLNELSEKDDVTFEDVEEALGSKTTGASKEDKKLGEELGLGAEDIVDFIDAGRAWLYMSMYDKKINFEEREEELDSLIQKSNKTPEEEARMKQLSSFLSPARKARSKFSDSIAYKGGTRKRLEQVAKIALAKMIQGGRIPEWLVLLILMGFQDGRLIISLHADKKSLPRF